MKKLLSLTLLFLVVTSVSAFATQKILYDNQSKPAVPIQNLKALAPAKAASGCNTQAITKGYIQGQHSSVNGYLGYSAEVVTAAGVAEPVKWELDGTQVASGPDFEFTNPQGSTYGKAKQKVYSAASRSLTSCTRRQ
ncbi:hypothetical protein KI809_18675 [Geobacter pelophilus]|uniref:Uncharacterized protein n=1 Tax=Geoanaerobacter pelophilus TaxID=60036 RepID=A0AAW4LEK1_9BACT|nr:hypothetical protein [Geoanaerobacter pelophilus]MBT0666337.1 hypothetical protein [Geoanaerobacter pelophilus]